MATKSPVVLILGAGPNIGQAAARTFAAKGYRVALVARSVKAADSTDSQLNIPGDLTKPETVPDVFATVRKTFGIPSVVIYNASAAAFPPADDPLALPLEKLRTNTEINLFSAFVAAQQAVAGFAQLPAAAARTFLYTGNILNVAILPGFLDAAIGKSAAAHMVWSVADAYKDRGYKFYYVDERKADGSPKYRVDGDAHGKMFWDLAQGKTQGPWLQTFVQGVGYKKFAVNM